MCCDLILQHEEEIAHDYDQINYVDVDVISDTPNLKPDVKLPKTELEWTEADLYFRAELPVSEVSEHSMSDCIHKMTNSVCDYFAENFGTVRETIRTRNMLITQNKISSENSRL